MKKYEHGGTYMSKSFRWAVDPTPDWFSQDNSYRMNPDTMQVEVPTAEGNAVVNPGDTISQDGEVYSVSQGMRTPAMNRQQRRQSKKMDEQLEVASISVGFTNGQTVQLDPAKIMIIDKDTKAALFNYVLDKEH